MSNMTKDEFVKNQIIEASKEVFKQYGYKNAKMEHIAKASGKGRSTLYYYYKNKDDVFRAFVNDFYQAMFDSFSSKLTRKNTVEENFSIYTEERINHLKAGMEAYNNLLSDLKQDVDFISHLLINFREKEIKLIENCLKWAIEKKEITPIAEENFSFLALAIVTTTSSIEKEIYLYETIKGDVSTRIKWINQLIIKSLKSN
ncbi:regulatory protein TetR [Cellulophaga algicola DSM 14237]|uniref:Regulatory protein TetR n=2 Tax=Cellulophaga TaxID=104264 RepID=E6X5E0_CELAD|nr:TetR/AcrR family transcriptional regulator [Cellulophaga algicola]ADV50495.1 regulatory protein TetR [Cellulophaga algicola DSM 14237]